MDGHGEILAQLRRGFDSGSPEQTLELGQRFAATLPPDSVVALEGDLGAGKTTFIRGMAAAWGIEGPVTSPTFNLYTLYSGGLRQLIHLDAYRLESADDMDALMIEDFLRSPWCLAIEWPSRIREWIPDGARFLNLAIKRPGAHTITLS